VILMNKHIPVLLNEVIDNLNLKETDFVVDSTLGYGGHSTKILQKIKKGHLFAFDQDSEAINYSANLLPKVGTNFTIINSNFDNMKEELNKLGINKVDKILFDLGVSSVQLDENRGFTYLRDEKLDMRMNTSQKFSAIDVVNNYKEEDLVNIFYKYGESKFSKVIAKNILKEREKEIIDTTSKLVNIIDESVPQKFKINKNPSKQIFQAIRIEVNHELDSIEKGLDQAIELLNINGRIAVITFHSLEDRIVKNKFKKLCEIDPIIKGNPDINDKFLPNFKLVNNKVIVASNKEIEFNSRSKSAKLRVIERIK